MQTPESILTFWYSEPMKSHWFSSTPEIDALIAQNYESLWRATADGQLDTWQDSPEGCLALCIVLDQFPLNMFRGEPASFSTEQAAVQVAKVAIEKGFDQQLPKEQLSFLYMPLMHSEHMQDQNLSVERFEASGLEGNIRFAKHHREIVERYGRFPHRNAILGRDSSDAEIEYLNSKSAFTG